MLSMDWTVLYLKKYINIEILASESLALMAPLRKYDAYMAYKVTHVIGFKQT